MSNTELATTMKQLRKLSTAELALKNYGAVSVGDYQMSERIAAELRRRSR